MQSFNALKERTKDILNLKYATALLEWDQQTYMPEGAAEARASQIATLSKLAHEMLTADETWKLIEAAEREVDTNSDSLEVAIVRITKRDFERSNKLPSQFVAEFAATTAMAHEIWVKARANNDYAAFLPTLEKIFDLCRQQAEYLGYEDHIYDA
ncbi:MAG: carboxypeptidase, partial [Phototrophicales bacterium]